MYLTWSQWSISIKIWISTIQRRVERLFRGSGKLKNSQDLQVPMFEYDWITNSSNVGKFSRKVKSCTFERQVERLKFVKFHGGGSRTRTSDGIDLRVNCLTNSGVLRFVRDPTSFVLAHVEILGARSLGRNTYEAATMTVAGVSIYTCI